MGRAKEEYMRQMEQGWSSVGAKWVCAKCFEDSAIQEFIREQASRKRCFYCRRFSRNLIAAEVHQGSLQGTPDLVFDLQLTGVLQDGPPILHLRPAGKDFELSWPAAYADWQLHESNTMQGAWPVAKEPVLLDQGWLYVQKPGVNRSFFRLEKP